ncbi:COG1361 S-layer family protein [Methanocaldococcus sp.]
MDFRKLLIGLLSMLIISTISANYGLQIEEPIYQPHIIHPGDDVDLWIKIVNDDYQNKVKNIVIKVSPHYPFELKQVNPIKGEVIIDSLNPGETYTAYFKLHVNENAPSNDYRIDVKVSYDEVYEDNGKETVVHYNFTKVYYIPVYGTASFEISGNTNLIPAKTEVVPITIKNTGTGTAKEVNVYIGYKLNPTPVGSEIKTVEYPGGTTIEQKKDIIYPTVVPLTDLPISPVDITKFYLGSLKPNTEKTINVKFHVSPNLLEGVYQVPVVVTWTDEDGSKKAEQISLGVYVKGDIILGISNVVTDPKEIKPGDTYVRIDVTVTNNGHAEAKNVILKLITKYPFKDSWSNCNIKDIGNLMPGSSKTVSFFVDVNKHAKAEHYQLPIKFSYLDPEDNEHNGVKYIDIYVKPKPLFEILTKEVNVTAGKDNMVYIKIKNIGSEKAERVKISAIRCSGQPFDYPIKSDTIGTLYPNQTGVGAIEIEVDKSAPPKPYIITLEIRCAGDSDEGDYNVYVYQKPLVVNVKSSNESIIVPILIGLIILAIIVGGYIKFRKNRKEKS